MHSLALAAALPLLFHSGSTQDAVQPTTLHFFPRTDCNTGSSLFYTTVADLYTDSTCHTTPTGTEALYVDGIAEGCAGESDALQALEMNADVFGISNGLLRLRVLGSCAAESRPDNSGDVLFLWRDQRYRRVDGRLWRGSESKCVVHAYQYVGEC